MIPMYECRPTPGDEAAVLAALRAGEWAGHLAATSFEADFAAYLDVRHAIATGNLDPQAVEAALKIYPNVRASAGGLRPGGGSGVAPRHTSTSPSGTTCACTDWPRLWGAAV